jgi:hypothetical protein
MKHRDLVQHTVERPGGHHSAAVRYGARSMKRHSAVVSAQLDLSRDPEFATKAGRVLVSELLKWQT